MRWLFLILVITLGTLALPLYAAITITYVGNFTYKTTDTVHISFKFNTIAPAYGDLVSAEYPYGATTTSVWDVEFLDLRNRAWPTVRVFSTAWEGRWDRDLVYVLNLYYFAPGQDWVLERYRVDWSGVTIYFCKVVKTPNRVSDTIKFEISRSQMQFFDYRSIKVSLPIQYRVPWYCDYVVKDLWTCGDSLCYISFNEQNTYSVSAPSSWRAEEINGFKAGDVIKWGGVEAKIPNPWTYRNAPFPSSGSFLYDISISVTVEPELWGSVELAPPREIPLYISRAVFGKPTDCSPPFCFLINSVGNSTWVGTHWVWNSTMYSAAFKTSFNLRPYIAFAPSALRPVLTRGISIELPLGSAVGFRVAVLWELDMAARRVWINSALGTFLRAAGTDGALIDYEEVSKNKKLVYSAPPLNTGHGVKWAELQIAVDENTPAVKTAWYSPPDPCAQWPQQIFTCVYRQSVFTKVNKTWVGYARVGPPGRGWPMRWLELVDWLIPYSFLNGHGTDLLSMLYGDYALFYDHVYRLKTWAFNPATGDFDIPSELVIRGARVSLVSLATSLGEYRNTTRDGAKLFYYTSSPYYGQFYNYLFEGVSGHELPAGWTDALPLGLAGMLSNETSPWLVSLVPTTACTSPICADIKPTLWGPTPSPMADVALPGAGYSLLITYIGEPRTVTVRIYVERGQILQRTASGIAHEPICNAPLATVSKTWAPLDGVYVGPGWWLPYKPLAPCESVQIDVNSIYTTPSNYTGPLLVTIEETETGKRYHFAFIVTNDVSLELRSTSRAPPVYTANAEVPLNTTALLYLGGSPYFHGLPGAGEGGRRFAFRCVTTTVSGRSYADVAQGAAQLSVAGDFWGEVEIWIKARVKEVQVLPIFEAADPERGLVKVSGGTGVVGFAFYLFRDGTWVQKAAVAGSCAVVNASKIAPWDPVLVLPIVEWRAFVYPNGEAQIPRPRAALLSKTWADLPQTETSTVEAWPCSR